MPQARERGAVLAMVLAIIAIVMIGLAASYALSRLGTAREDTGQIARTLAAAAEAVEQYAGTAQRLPCPANPAVDEGLEVAAGANCTFAAGTVPWRTIGMRRDDAFDPWGRKISYRVFSGATGFTQAGGISMAQCDSVEPGVGAVGANGLCIPNADPTARNSSEARFLQGKGLNLTESGVARKAAYVLISHGLTGLGGFTASGAQMALPGGGSPERDHVQATGPFMVRAFSDAETKASANDHYDDFVVYRAITDLVKRLGLQARDWPEADPTVTTALTFDAPTISAATGATPSPTTPLANSIDFGSAQVTAGNAAFDANPSSTPPSLSYDVDTVTGRGALGVTSGVGNQISSLTGEYLRIVLPRAAAKFGVTLNQFDTLFGVFERVEFRFLEGTTLRLTVQKTACHASTSNLLTSYSIDVAGAFDRVEIRPLASSLAIVPTSLSVASIAACTAAASSCRTALAIAAAPPGSTEDCP